MGKITTVSPYKDFTARLKLLISKNPHLITTTLSNIFTMRLIGNKTHGDLAEIAIDEFINQFMPGLQSEHVGKKRFRAKKREEDIEITDAASNIKFPVSLKAYGWGAIQLSTDKAANIYGQLQAGANEIVDKQKIEDCWNDLVASDLQKKNVLALIYDEKKKVKRFNVLTFNDETAKACVVKIQKVTEGEGRLHPVFRFLDSDGVWVCEVRYGGGSANALQRGLWSDTKKAEKYFESLLPNGWITYSHNEALKNLLFHALVATSNGHEAALEKLKQDIEQQKQKSQLG